MGSKSKIEWTDATWNPVKGCSRVSEGCRNCYAERMAARGLPGLNSPATGEPFAIMTPSGPRWTGRVELDESKLELPLHWRKPRRVFVNSMSDLFHERLPEEAIDHVWAVMALCPQHEFIVLTKRAARLSEYIGGRQHGRMCDIAQTINGGTHGGAPYPLPHITLGVSAEDQPTADERITRLLRTPAARRIVSLEPLLGPVDLRDISAWTPTGIEQWDSLDRVEAADAEPGSPNTVIDGVIVGGESGPGARPMHPDWVRSIRDQCQEAGVAFFFKQWGEYAPITFDDRHGRAWRTDLWVHPDGTAERDRAKVRDFAWPMHRLGKKRAGALLDGCEWRDWPCP